MRSIEQLYGTTYNLKEITKVPQSFSKGMKQKYQCPLVVQTRKGKESLPVVSWALMSARRMQRANSLRSSLQTKPNFLQSRKYKEKYKTCKFQRDHPFIFSFCSLEIEYPWWIVLRVLKRNKFFCKRDFSVSLNCIKC